jgi:hypothetical protein
LVLALIIGGGFVWLAGADRVTGQPLMLTKRPLALYNRQDVGQTLEASDDGLHRIDIFFNSRNEARSRQVSLSIYDQHGRLLLTQEVDAHELRDAWYAFVFSPLVDIAGTTLRLDLRRNAGARESVGIWVGPGSAYPGGYGVIDNVPDPSFDIAFRAYAAVPPWFGARLERARQLATDLSAQRSGLAGQPAWLLTVAAAYAVGLGCLGTLVLAMYRWRE